jgi:hypothetical protein
VSDIYPGQKRMILSSNDKLKRTCTHIVVEKISSDIVYYYYPEEQKYFKDDPYTRGLEYILKHTIPDHVYLAQRQFDKDLEDLLKE